MQIPLSFPRRRESICIVALKKRKEKQTCRAKQCAAQQMMNIIHFLLKLLGCAMLSPTYP